MSVEILIFWFQETKPTQWWTVDPQFDQLIAQRFSAIHAAATKCKLHSWRATPHGRLAEIIVLDQFSRNLHRNSPLAFANDPLALALSQEAVAARADVALTQSERMFLYMPHMHSESKAVHVEAERLFRANGEGGGIDSELKHKAIIDRFGRYPHRNPVLGRTSTAEELAFLQQPGSRF